METCQGHDGIVRTRVADLPDALRGLPGTLKMPGEYRYGNVATTAGAQPPDSQLHSLHSTQGPSTDE